MHLASSGYAPCQYMLQNLQFHDPKTIINTNLHIQSMLLYIVISFVSGTHGDAKPSHDTMHFVYLILTGPPLIECKH